MIVTLGPEQQEAANTFLTAGTLKKEYEKKREAAKHVLIEALGKHSEGVLPDGRRVTKTIAHFEEASYTRGAYDSTTLAVSALTASVISDELAKLAPPKTTRPPDRGKPAAKAKSSAPPKARVGK